MAASRQRCSPRPKVAFSFRSAIHETNERVEDCFPFENKEAKSLMLNPSVTYFEIVTPPHQLSRSHSAESNPRVKQKKPHIIAIIEENYQRPLSPTVYHQAEASPPFSLSLTPSDSCFSLSRQTFTDQLDDERKEQLDGRLLPDLSTYTAAEKNFLKEFYPVLFYKNRKSLSLGESSETSCFWAM